jgi:hypothetical protein
VRASVSWIYRRLDEWLSRNEFRGFVAELIIVGPDAAGSCINDVFIVGDAEAEYESVMRKNRTKLLAAHATFRIPFMENVERLDSARSGANRMIVYGILFGLSKKRIDRLALDQACCS